jgi:hypothetical protein
MLGCIQPMSSPMMKRMLGFWFCAKAEITPDPKATKTVVMTNNSFLMDFINKILSCAKNHAPIYSAAKVAVLL